MPDIACVVVAYHRPDALGRLLSALEHPRIARVVVNVEDDTDVSRLALRHRCLEIGIPNLGYAAALNRGVSRVSAETVVLMNDDVLVEAGAAISLADRARDGGRVVLPSLVDLQGQREPTLQAFASARSLLLEWALSPDRPPRWLSGRHLQKWRSPTKSTLVEAGAATVVAAPVATLRIHPFPEEYFLYWEDTEWFWRLRQAGIEVEFVPDVQVLHTGGRVDVRPEKSRLMARNAVRCVRRTRGAVSAAVAWPVVILWNLRLVIVDLCRRTVGGAPPERVAARLAGLRASLAAWREIL
jgi:GT2 family glycosyltransferase